MKRIFTGLLCSLALSLPASAEGIVQMTLHEHQLAMIAKQPALRHQFDQTFWNSQIMRVKLDLFGFDDDSSVYAIIEGYLDNDEDTAAVIINFLSSCDECAPGGVTVVNDPPVPDIPLKPDGIDGTTTPCDPNDANSISLSNSCSKPN